MNYDTELDEFNKHLAPYAELWLRDMNLWAVVEVAVDKIAAKKASAGYGGDHYGIQDADNKFEELKQFLAGIEYSQSGNFGPYQAYADLVMKEADPEYQKYLELKRKFEK